MLNHCLEWYKWVLTNFDHDRQWFNRLFHCRTRPQNAQMWLLTVDCISRSSGRVRLILRYTTPDIHCRDMRYEWDGGIRMKYKEVSDQDVQSEQLWWLYVGPTKIYEHLTSWWPTRGQKCSNQIKSQNLCSTLKSRQCQLKAYSTALNRKKPLSGPGDSEKSHVGMTSAYID